MAKRQSTPGAGRPSKGVRRPMLTRLSPSVAEEIMGLAEELDLSYSDTMAALIEIGLRHEDLPRPAQEVLPATA